MLNYILNTAFNLENWDKEYHLSYRKPLIYYTVEFYAICDLWHQEQL